MAEADEEEDIVEDVVCGGGGGLGGNIGDETPALDTVEARPRLPDVDAFEPRLDFLTLSVWDLREGDLLLLNTDLITLALQIRPCVLECRMSGRCLERASLRDRDAPHALLLQDGLDSCAFVGGDAKQRRHQLNWQMRHVTIIPQYM
jgi:hypothetical protein